MVIAENRESLPAVLCLAVCLYEESELTTVARSMPPLRLGV